MISDLKIKYQADVFFQSRVKLTGLLILLFAPIILIVTALITYVFYSQINQEYDFLGNGPMMIGPAPMNNSQRLEKIEEIIQRKVLAPIEITTRRVLPIVYIFDILLVICSSIIFYQIAGRIQRPIQNYLSLSKNFVSQASHELKTPLSIIRSEVSLAETLQEIDPKVAISIKEEVERMNNISSDLLHIERLSKRDGYTLASSDIIVIVKDSITSMQKYASIKNISIEQNIDTPNFNALINTDDLRTAMRNILKNAVDFSTESSKILINCERSQDKLTVSIRDFGKGMDESTLSKITEPFFKSRLPEDGSGHGLGMHLVSKICIKNSIELNISSSLGQGTTISLTFQDHHL